MKLDYQQLELNVHRRTLSSGLQVAFIPRRGFTKTFALYAVKYGSIDNAFSTCSNPKPVNVPDGIAHFLEHKLFDSEQGNVFDTFSELGASANASTGFDMTAYIFTATQNLPQNLETLLKFVQTPYFTDQSVAKEQGIIAQEINMYNDSPSWRVFFNMLGALYHNHPVKLDIAGSVESIGKISKQLLYDCYSGFYRPDNMVCVVVGDVDVDELTHVIECNVASCASSNIAAESVFPAEPSTVCHPYVQQEMSVARPMFSFGFKLPACNTSLKDYLEFELLAAYLLGKGSPFFDDLYNDGILDNSFGFEVSIGRGYSFLSFNGESNRAQLFAERLVQHLKSLKSQGLNAELFEQTRRCLYGRFIRKLNNIERLGYEYADWLFKGQNYFDCASLLSQVTIADITVRLDMLQGDCHALSCVNPIGHKE